MRTTNPCVSATLGVVLLMSFMSASFAYSGNWETIEDLEEPFVKMEATSPGHSVFGEYVGAHWCGPCMSSASPSLDNLKTSNPEDFTYVSFYESSSGGWPNDSPINRRSHIMAGSSGYPTFSFADEQTSPCLKVGAGGSNYYDPEYSSGGCMDPTSNDFQLDLTTTLDAANSQVTITLEANYVGPQPSVSVYVYGAITEKVGADAYDNGVKPHHNWRGWLLNPGSSGFLQMTLDRNNPIQHTWIKPLSLVRASSGYSQWENFWPVLALMDGPHSSYNEFYAAIDLDMGPLVDLGVSEFESEISGGHIGLIPGDQIALSASVTNNGAEQHPTGAELVFSYMDGLDHVEIHREDVPSLSSGQSIHFSTDFDTTALNSVASGAVSIRAALENVDSDRVSSNNNRDLFIPYDMPPIATRPVTVDGSVIYRGEALTFELSAIPDDNVDDLTTMAAMLEYSLHAEQAWSSDWTTSEGLIGAGGNLRVAHEVSTPLTAQTGNYDTRVKWVDSRGQASDWLVTESAFTLQNAIPSVVSPTDPNHAGMPTVKVETVESIPIAGLIWDAETELGELEIWSSAPQFIAWDPDSESISVEFDRIVYDSVGSPIPQGLFISIRDGEDTNTGTLLFNVIENGAPRWSSIPPQSFDEGESASVILTSFVSDTDEEGQPTNPSQLGLEIVDVQPGEAFETILVGHTLSVSAVDEDYVGTASVTVSASDGDQTTETVVTFFVNDINDAPRINPEGIQRIVTKTQLATSVNLSEHVYDVDHDFEDLWVDIESFDVGSISYDFPTGVLTMTWDEPGLELITITAIDPIGDSVSHVMEIEVVDSLPLAWEGLDSQPDLSATFDTLDYNTNPVITVNQITDHGLADIKIRWQVCNSLTGVCTDAGSSFGFSPFSIQANEGVGLRVGDYVGLTVTAIDSLGFDRKSEMLRSYAVEPVDDASGTGEEGQEAAGRNRTPYLILTISLFTIATLLVSGIVVLRSKSEQSRREIDNQPSRNPDLPLPSGGLPDGWTLEQWYYYGEEYLRGER